MEVVPANSSGRADPSGEEADGGITIERREKYSAVCKWLIPNFSKLKQRTTRCLWSKYFEVGGYDCRLLVYPAGELFASKVGLSRCCSALMWKPVNNTSAVSREQLTTPCTANAVSLDRRYLQPS